MKRLQILVTIAFIISIMSLNAFALPQAGPEPNSNIQNGNTPNGNIQNGNIQNGGNPSGSDPKSNNPNGNIQNGGNPSGNAPKSNTPNGNIQNGNTPNSNNPDSNAPKSNSKSNEGKAEKGKCHKHHKHHKDPLKKLEEKKENIGKDLKEGKITKEKADELTKKIDERIKQINEFNSLPLPEKKQRLSKNFNSSLEKKILEGKLTKEEGEKLQADFNKQLESWDGKDFPRFKLKSKHQSDKE